MKYLIVSLSAVLLLSACTNAKEKFDAQGVFESNEIMVSAEQSGKLQNFAIQEGDSVQANQLVATIDSANLTLQKAQLIASKAALSQKLTDINPQIALLNKQMEVQLTQENNILLERSRVENLLKNDAATKKQLDDINFQLATIEKQILVTKQQLNVQVNNIGTQNRAIMSEASPIQKKIDQVQDLINKTNVLNPIKGIVLTTYVNAGEMVAAGKPLYKVANLDYLTLRIYITGDQLSKIAIGNPIKVLVDKDKNEYEHLQGKVIAIASKAEFTPKTIQTKDERANLVYAVKVQVKNNGLLKIGMYGEVQFQ